MVGLRRGRGTAVVLSLFPGRQELFHEDREYQFSSTSYWPDAGQYGSISISSNSHDCTRRRVLSLSHFLEARKLKWSRQLVQGHPGI